MSKDSVVGGSLLSTIDSKVLKDIVRRFNRLGIEKLTIVTDGEDTYFVSGNAYYKVPGSASGELAAFEFSFDKIKNAVPGAKDSVIFSKKNDLVITMTINGVKFVLDGVFVQPPKLPAFTPLVSFNIDAKPLKKFSKVFQYSGVSQWAIFEQFSTIRLNSNGFTFITPTAIGHLQHDNDLGMDYFIPGAFFKNLPFDKAITISANASMVKFSDGLFICNLETLRPTDFSDEITDRSTAKATGVVDDVATLGQAIKMMKKASLDDRLKVESYKDRIRFSVCNDEIEFSIGSHNLDELTIFTSCDILSRALDMFENKINVAIAEKYIYIANDETGSMYIASLKEQ